MTSESQLESQIEAILFWKGESVSLKRLAELLKKDETEIAEALKNLEATLSDPRGGRGVMLIRKEDEVMLGTRPEMSHLIETLTKEELIKDIGKAGLETLSIILYRGPSSRRDIDYVRGVNSGFIIRNLLIRGLIEKVSNPADEHSFLYKPTFQLMQYLGVGGLEELPEFEAVKAELVQYDEAAKAETGSETETAEETESHTAVQPHTP